MSYLSSDEFQKSSALGATWAEILADYTGISVEQVGGIWVATVAVEKPPGVYSLDVFMRGRDWGWGDWKYSGVSSEESRALFYMTTNPTPDQIGELADLLKRAGVYAGS